MQHRIKVSDPRQAALLSACFRTFELEDSALSGVRKRSKAAADAEAAALAAARKATRRSRRLAEELRLREQSAGEAKGAAIRLAVGKELEAIRATSLTAAALELEAGQVVAIFVNDGKTDAEAQAEALAERERAEKAKRAEDEKKKADEKVADDVGKALAEKRRAPARENGAPAPAPAKA